MATVDLAGFCTIGDAFPDAEVTLYIYGNVNEHNFRETEFPFKYYNLTQNMEKYFQSDLFIFWGDFFHSYSYWKYDLGEWKKGNKEELPPEDQKWALFFLSNFSRLGLKKVVIFGSTIISNDAEDETDLSYHNIFSHLFINAHSVYFRDALSAAKIISYRGDERTLGCDCALLLKQNDLLRLKDFRQADSKEGVGVFFGRTNSKWRMMLFAKLLCSHLEIKCNWIHWFWSRKKFRLLARAFGLNIQPGFHSPGEILSDLTNYKYIITDTYHLCVNAWRMGIPAICIGEGASYPDNSLSDKKKEIFYEMYGARQYYVFSERLKNPFSLLKECRRLAKLLRNDAISNRVHENIKTQSDSAKDRLIKSLQDILHSA